uniref:Chemosensory protein 9 n=1 Tax=Ectropis obliqua TaxID=248899 RepID=A0A1L2BL63_ECTOB|nr:chemosensory protein 9 [Ectropis obliqua]
MKLLLIAVLITLASLHTLAQTYNDKYDGMNIDQALANKRLLKAYINCVLDAGKCTPEGKELKGNISDALQSGCVKCTGPQRAGIRKVIAHLINHEERYWNQLVDKYDPKRLYSHKYENELKAIKG